MKKIFAVVLLLISINTYAQFYAGVRMGVSISNQFANIPSYNNSSYNYGYGGTNSSSTIQTAGDFKTGLNFGIQGGYFFRRFIALQTELTSMPMGFIVKDGSGDYLSLSYIQWNPVMVKFLTGKVNNVQFFVSSGFSLGFPILAKEYSSHGQYTQDPQDPFKADLVTNQDIKPAINTPDLSLIIGLGLSIPVGNGKLEFEGRYQGGATNVYNYSLLGIPSQTPSIFNMNVIFQAGYYIFFSRPQRSSF